MRKSNWIVFVLFAAAAVLLVVLWYVLGLDKVDAPLDLVLGIVFIVLIALVAFVLIRMELRRRKLLRAIYVAVPDAFNTEYGSLPAGSISMLIDAAGAVLEGLEYATDTLEAPADFEPGFVIETDRFVAGGVAESDGVVPRLWSGRVENSQTGTGVDFGSIEELREILVLYYR